MDYKERYLKLLEKNKQLKNELESLRFANNIEKDISGDVIYKFFHSSSNLIAISNFETGKYVDVNSAFLSTSGYRKEEIIGHTSDEIIFFYYPEEIKKFISQLQKSNKIKDYPVTLRSKDGEQKSCLFSAEKLIHQDEVYLLSIFYEIPGAKDEKIKDSTVSVRDEIFETVSSYLALYSIGDDNRFYIIDLNSKVEEVEFIRRGDVLGKCINDTPLSNRVKLIELLHYLRINGHSHKLSSSPKGDDSEGYYIGFLLTSGNIVVTWEPGYKQKNLENLYKQGIIFETFAEMLPEMVYEVDITGKVLYV